MLFTRVGTDSRIGIGTAWGTAMCPHVGTEAVTERGTEIGTKVGSEVGTEIGTLVTRTTAISNIGFRLIYACHKNDCIYRYWRSSHFRLSEERLQISTLAFVSVMLVTRTSAIFDVGFRLISACHKNDSYFQYWLSSHLCLSEERVLVSVLALVSLMLFTRGGTESGIEIGSAWGTAMCPHVGTEVVTEIGTKVESEIGTVIGTFVTRTTAIYTTGFRVISACHKKDCNYHYWLSSHLC